MSTTRRNLLAGALLAIPFARRLRGSNPEPRSETRTYSALSLRQIAAIPQSGRPSVPSLPNSDETAIPNWIACFTKGLPQNQFGEVDPAAYRRLLLAVNSGSPDDFEQIPKGAGRKLSNPQAAFAFQLEGADSHKFAIPPAPSITSHRLAVEAAELYWQALCRDVPFSEYSKSAVVQHAASDLGISPERVFRGHAQNAFEGPYISQFLAKPIPYGSSKLDQRYRVPLANVDFMTSVSEWT
jgi:hypothetical protein